MYYTKDQTATIHDQTFHYLKVEEADHVLTITLNREAKKNALTPIMVQELAFAMRYASCHTNIWTVVIKAKGDVFCAGADLKAFMGATEEHTSTIPAAEGEILIGELFNKLHRPCIVVVEGDVYAGGFLFLAGATHVVACNHVKLGLPEAKRGLWPFQVMASMMEVMPKRKVLDWCIRGYNLPVELAEEYGLVTDVVIEEEVTKKLETLVSDIHASSPSAIRMGLEATDHIRQSSTAENHAYLQQMLMKTVSSGDAREGIQAFREKRKPNWTGQ